MSHSKYTSEGYRGLAAKAEDRTAAIRGLIEGAGGKLLHLWYANTGCELVPVFEGDAVVSTSATIASMASGAFSQMSGMELITPAQFVAAMQAASGLITQFRAPGK